ncbi:hypothetical protein JTB14_035260 [Gonioctena quinquepunctata]|nr:hypothetical protein JTB14_035260 [Gonioctena quinquepunctata]
MGPFTTIVFLAILLGVFQTHSAMFQPTPPPCYGVPLLVDVRRNGRVRQRRDYEEPCCLVPQCQQLPLKTENDNSFECYKTEVCGDACTSGNSRRVPRPYSPSTSGYQRKDYYMKERCSPDQLQCVNYRFNCRLCPDPGNQDFSIYTLKSECIDCYH